MKKQILFHVGLHKTGTSSLQHSFFQPRNQFVQHAEGRSWWLPIFVDKFSTELLTAAERSRISSFVEDAYSQGCIPVASHERFSGYPVSGGYDRLSIYRRIASLDHDVKVLFLMREQKGWLYSAWRQVVLDGASIGLREFIESPSQATTARMPKTRLEYLNYAREIATLHELFGPNNVCILPMELLASDFSQFVKQLRLLLEHDKVGSDSDNLDRRNESKTLTSLGAMWFLNKFLVSSSTSPGGVVSGETKSGKRLRQTAYSNAIELPEMPLADRLSNRHKRLIEETVGDFYADSNTEVAAKLGIELHRFGYELRRSDDPSA